MKNKMLHIVTITTYVILVTFFFYSLDFLFQTYTCLLHMFICKMEYFLFLFCVPSCLMLIIRSNLKGEGNDNNITYLGRSYVDVIWMHWNVKWICSQKYRFFKQSAVDSNPFCLGGLNVES